MWVSVEKGAFLKALSHQNTIVEKRTNVPILSHVLLIAKEKCQQLSFVGTDLEVSLMEEINVEVKEEGQTTVSVHMLYDIVRKLPDAVPIILETLGKEGVSPFLHLSCGGAKFQFPTLSPTSFPEIHKQELTHQLTIPSESLRKLIQKTRFAMSTEEARYTLNGIYFHPVGNKWKAVATNAHRLALSWIFLPPETLKAFPSVIVGRKAINELYKLLEDDLGEITLCFSSHQILVQFENAQFSSRLLEGNFPEYWQAIPENFNFEVFVNKEVFSKSVERVGMVSAEKNRVVKLSFQDKKLSFSAESEQYGTGFEQISIECENSPSFSVNFNPRYLLDIAGHVEGEQLKISFKDQISPALFQDLTNDQVLFVLMPMRG